MSMSNENFLFNKTQCLLDMNELCETSVKTINHSVWLILSTYQSFVAHFFTVLMVTGFSTSIDSYQLPQG